MRNLFFQELVVMMEDRFGNDIKEKVLNNSQLDHSGTFRTRDNYDHQQFTRMVANFGNLIHLPYNSTMRAFGRHLNKTLIKKFPHIFKSQRDTFSLLHSFDLVILEEAKKFFPVSQIPTITISSPEPNLMIVKYESDLPLADIVEGMILSTVDYYNENINVVGYDIDATNNNKRKFILTKKTD